MEALGAAVPRFPDRGDQAPRILIEDANADARQRAARSLRRAGYQIAVCGGPEELSHRRGPLEEGDRCPAVSDANLVLSSLPSEDHRQAAVLAALRERFPSAPVIIEASALMTHRHRYLMQDWVVLSRFIPTTLPEAVEEACGV